MENKRIIVVIDPKTEQALKRLQRKWKINRSATIRYCINYCEIRVKNKRI